MSNIKYKDHLGNIYNSITEMCKHYKISNGLYQARKKLNWPLEDILTKPSKQSVTDPAGNRFANLTEMLKYYNIDKNTYMQKISAGMSMEHILGYRKFNKNEIIGQYTVIRLISDIYYLVKTNDDHNIICDMYMLIEELNKETQYDN